MFRRIASQLLTVERRATSFSSSSSSSWPEKVLSNVVVQLHSETITSPEDTDWLFFKNPDNASICPCPIVECKSEDALHLILRWTKLLVLKLVRSYCALPVVLVAIPLLLGLLIGFVIGRRTRGRIYQERQERFNNITEPQQQRQRDDQHRGLGQKELHGSWFNAVAVWISTTLSSFFLLVTHRHSTSSQSRDDVSSVRKTNNRNGNDHDRLETTTSKTSNSLDSGNLRLQGTPHQSKHEEESRPLFFSTPSEMKEREERARQELQSAAETTRESGVEVQNIPQHVAIIMDGNRRYGKAMYGNATSGHWDGSRKLLQVAKWCIAEQIQILTVYAFSTENWRRDPSEVASLMAIFVKYCEELRQEAIRRNIRVNVLSSDASRIPAHVKTGLDRLQNDTAGCKGGLLMNICLSYGSRGEIVNACRRLANATALGKLQADDITEAEFQEALMTSHCPDPDVLIRTSGEYRLSNFLLWQLAYTELFFVDRNWPEFEKSDLLNVIRSFAKGRSRRFGQ